jgi:hypothetical protein
VHATGHDAGTGAGAGSGLGHCCASETMRTEDCSNVATGDGGDRNPPHQNSDRDCKFDGRKACKGNVAVTSFGCQNNDVVAKKGEKKL